MTNYQRFLKETRQARVPLARISNQLRYADKGLKRRAIFIAFLSLTALTCASAVLISMQPLTPIRPRLAAFSPRLGASFSPERTVQDDGGKAKSGDAADAGLEGAGGGEVNGGDPLAKNGDQLADAAKMPLQPEAGGAQPKSDLAGKAGGVDHAIQTHRNGLEALPPGQVVFPDEPASASSEEPEKAIAQTAAGDLPKRDAPASTIGMMASAVAPSADINGARQPTPAAFASTSASSALIAAVGTPANDAVNPRNSETQRPPTLGVTSAALSEVPCKVQIQAWTAANVVRFDKASSVVSPKQGQKLRELGQALDGCRGVQIDVGGHADKSGEQLGNLQLSWQRAEQVIKTIKALGFQTDRLAPVGFSASRPLVRDATPEANAMNRRVEFIVR